MNTEVKEKWLEALRSGEYEQGEGYLNKDGRFCCLGVLCDLAERKGIVTSLTVDEGHGIGYGEAVTYSYLPQEVRDWADTETGDGYGYNPRVWHYDSKDNRALSDVNDSGESFDEIADLIEKCL